MRNRWIIILGVIEKGFCASGKIAKKRIMDEKTEQYVGKTITQTVSGRILLQMLNNIENHIGNIREEEWERRGEIRKENLLTSTL